MKKIINGKIFDTDKADVIASRSNGYGFSDFNHCYETLYRTVKGSWFLYGEGGPLSKYAEPVKGGSAGGRDIIVMTEQEAIDWMQKHNKIEALEAYFPNELGEA